MFTTTLAVVAVAGTLGAGASPSPGWQSDYAHALTLAATEHKPIAVFIGPGGKPADKALSSDSTKLLHDGYVCLAVDTDTAAGKALAGKFALSEGLVISSPGGTYQALRHSGPVSGSDLTSKLNRYAAAGQPTTTTYTGGATVGTAASATVAPIGCIGGNCGAQPTIGSFIVPSAQAYPYGSSCPNGKCPLQR